MAKTKALTTLKKELTPDQLKAAKFTAATLEITKRQAGELLFGDKKIDEYLKYNKRLSDIGGIEMLKRIETAIVQNTRKGRPNAVKGLTTAWGIVRDKVFGKDAAPSMVIEGRNIQINLGWAFGAYGKKPKSKPKSK